MAFNLSKFTSVLTMIAPVVVLLVPGGAFLAPLVPLIVKTVADAEASKKTGPEKRAYVIMMVENAANALNIVKPDTVKVDLIKEASGHAVDAIVGTINSVAKAQEALPDVPPIVSVKA